MNTRTALLLLFTLQTIACFGGLENDPFESGVGEIRGAISGPVDVERAWIVIAGDPEKSAAITADGRFVLRDVARGDRELIASDGIDGASRLSVAVYSERAVDVAIETQIGSAIGGRVFLEEQFTDLFPRRVSIQGLPARTNSDGQGRFRIPALPPGCHTLVAEHENFEPIRIETCAAQGQEVHTNVHLRHETSHLGALCAPCDGDAACESGLCALFGGEQTCAQPCGAGCPAGTHCLEIDGGRHACVDPETTCASRTDFFHRTPCGEDDDCGLTAVSDGVCSPAMECTLRCGAGHACPGTSHCVNDLCAL